jgi:nucleotide-binding universal stress UspA family protein
MSDRTLLVAYDASPDAERALRWAVDEAVRDDMRLVVATIDDASTSLWGGDIWLRDPEQVTHAERLLAELGVEATVERRSGNVTGTLLELAESASMVVVGSRGHSGVAEAAIGSVSQHVARHAPCTVVVVRAPKRRDAGRIVVGLDGSPTSAAALEFACQRAERTGELVVAVHGWRVHTTSTDVWRGEAREISDAVEDKEVLVAESVAGVREAHPDVVLVTEAIPVPPGDVLVDASAGASLVVVGSRGRGFFTGMLLGSVSQDVLRRAQCPVAVVR